MSTSWRTSRVITAALVLVVACASPREPAAAATRQANQYQTGSLDQLLAPIALYPDSLLAQILMAAADPAKVTEFDKWLKANQSLKGTKLQDAAVKAGFDPSLVALSLFPQVVAKMAEQTAWTTLLGQAFAGDRNAVFASIQKLRHQAKAVGTLKSNEQQEVQTKTTSAGEEVIVIEPANPQIVYVPQYNTEVVYTQAPTTTVVVQESNDSGAAVAAGMIGFTAGIAIGAAMDNNYYYGPYGWRGGAYMYNDAWDDYYDHREDARDDWQDHREDLNENRTDRAKNAQEQRTERTESRNENRPETAARTGEARSTAQSATAQTQRTNRTGSTEARGYSEGASTRSAGTQRSGGGSDAFSGYSSGASQRSASSRGKSSRGSSRSSGGGGRRR